MGGLAEGGGRRVAGRLPKADAGARWGGGLLAGSALSSGLPELYPQAGSADRRISVPQSSAWSVGAGNL